MFSSVNSIPPSQKSRSQALGRMESGVVNQDQIFFIRSAIIVQLSEMLCLTIVITVIISTKRKPRVKSGPRSFSY